MDLSTFVYPAFSTCRLHLAVCGSISVYKALEVMRLLQKQGIQVSASLTESAKKFLSPLLFSSLGADPVYASMFSEGEPPFAHLEPGMAADTFVVLPATATTMARIASGLADDIVSAQALAFKGPLLFAPAMNPSMWSNQATQANLSLLTSRGHSIIPPESGKVACGDIGTGKLPSIDVLFLYTLRHLARAKGFNDLQGKKILITLGPTHEKWDAVRYWTNPSSGLMGLSLAYAAWLRGAEVFAVLGGEVHALPLNGFQPISTPSAKEMAEAVFSRIADVDIAIFTAAVADFSPVPYGNTKFKKDGNTEGFTLQFKPNADIIATAGAMKREGQVFIGFAAETENLVQNAQAKLQRKNADMIVANLIGKADSGFGVASNTVTIIERGKEPEALPTMSKSAVAWEILNRL